MAVQTINKLRRSAAEGGFGSVKEYLEAAYQRKSLAQLASDFEMSKSGVHKLMHTYKVPMRPRGGANRS